MKILLKILKSILVLALIFIVCIVAAFCIGTAVNSTLDRGLDGYESVTTDNCVFHVHVNWKIKKDYGAAGVFLDSTFPDLKQSKRSKQSALITIKIVGNADSLTDFSVTDPMGKTIFSEKSFSPTTIAELNVNNEPSSDDDGIQFRYDGEGYRAINGTYTVTINSTENVRFLIWIYG